MTVLTNNKIVIVKQKTKYVVRDGCGGSPDEPAAAAGRNLSPDPEHRGSK